jgi:hypothetical protein
VLPKKLDIKVARFLPKLDKKEASSNKGARFVKASKQQIRSLYRLGKQASEPFLAS